MSFFAELRRRNVFRVAASYVVVAWLVLQVTSTVQDPLRLPEWFDTLIVVLLAMGFPIALVFAWAFELTPTGIERTVAADDKLSPRRTAAVDYALIGGLVLVALVTVWTNWATRAGTGEDGIGIAEIASIAVLPFADFSEDSSQRYFGDGIAEELLNVLTRLDGLRVAGRTSSFAYRGENLDLREIGEALGVTTILEGSVRKNGDNLRVTAQLINAADGYHLWSNTYDRELTDIFVIQEEIAEEVAGALGITLGVGDVNAYLGAGTRSLEAYETYLQALSLPEEARIELLNRALQIDPNYAAAWARLGFTTAASMWDGLPEEASEKHARAMSQLERAIALDPESAEAHTMLGVVRYAGFDWIGGEEAFERAQALSRTRVSFQQNGNLRMRAGRMNSAQSLYDLAERIEPLGGQPALLSYHVSIAQGRFDEAREILEWVDNPEVRSGRLLVVALNEGEPETIRAAIESYQSAESLSNELFRAILPTLESPDASLEMLYAQHNDETRRWPSKGHDIGVLAAYFGDPQLALESIAADVRYQPPRIFLLWYPITAGMRALPGFKDLVRDTNLVDYWRAYGWADACRPLGEDDFVCS
jgi:TolB-like protein/Tfp pilus assembly protein PilF